MTARILVVDDVPANVKLLEVRLLAEYFEVLTATNGPDAIEICENGKIDVVLRLLRGESLEDVSREVGVEAHRLAAWRDDFLESGKQGLKQKRPGPRGTGASRRRNARSAS